MLGYSTIGCIFISRLTSNIKSTFSLGHASTMIVNDVRGNTINQWKRRKGYEKMDAFIFLISGFFTYCSIWKFLSTLIVTSGYFYQNYRYRIVRIRLFITKQSFRVITNKFSIKRLGCKNSGSVFLTFGTTSTAIVWLNVPLNNFAFI